MATFTWLIRFMPGLSWGGGWLTLGGSRNRVCPVKTVQSPQCLRMKSGSVSRQFRQACVRGESTRGESEVGDVDPGELVPVTVQVAGERIKEEHPWEGRAARWLLWCVECDVLGNERVTGAPSPACTWPPQWPASCTWHSASSPFAGSPDQ